MNPPLKMTYKDSKSKKTSVVYVYDWIHHISDYDTYNGYGWGFCWIISEQKWAYISISDLYPIT